MSASEFSPKPIVKVESQEELKRPTDHQQTLLTLAKLIRGRVTALPCGSSFQSGEEGMRFARFLELGAVKP